ncbi:MAG TPA: hypothetical protein VES73_00325 [Lamprocystis sp. (in: g-proteobacteria)]|nr:hypothetical protein [Lamprocystis sp. (in: g-proteobacteria)]
MVDINAPTTDFIGADLRYARVYRTDFAGSEFSLADLRDLRPPLFDGLDDEIDSLRIEPFEAYLDSGNVYHLDSRRRWKYAIDRLWSVVFDPPALSPGISPLQAFDAMYDPSGRIGIWPQTSIFVEWPSPPDEAHFEATRAVYRAGLACTDKYVSRRMHKVSKSEPALATALKIRTASGKCPIVAVLLKNEESPEIWTRD